ncbi:F-box/LRR-repeat protein 13-like [Chenopodium quinoa]|uniref:F-box/LRR-repeat protein 13-like n=1 Tax=Chenopodium quinoa TaxID=63459 RepID=UPI000B7980BB|nr:F-box/LRR-repeat protein 13-like [Chenopodium quinoa]
MKESKLEERERVTKMANIDSRLARMCIDAATDSRYAVDKWRLQRRSLERLPSPLASALLHRLLHRRLLFPSLLEVFKFSVEEVDLSGENSVDAEWMAYLGAFSYLCSLNVADCYRINNPALWPLAGMTSLMQLDLSRCMKVTDSGIKHLLSLSQLQKLHLSQTGVTADGVKLLSALRNLSTLDLGGLPVSDLALSSLRELTNLEYLDVWGSEISDEGAAALKNFPKLSFLNVAWTNITKFPNLQSIQSLNMSDCTILSALEDKSDRVTLRKLIAHGSSFPEAEMVFSTIEASCLSFLNLSNTSLSNFGFLRCMVALEQLDLSSCTIQDDAVEAISCIGANLRHLNLNNTKVSNAGLETLAGHVPNLEALSLSHTLIDDSAIAYMSTMPSLTTLDLSNTNIKGFIHPSRNEDEVFSLAALQDLKHLERLDLEKTKVNDAAVYALLGSGELSHLSLNSTALTDKCLEYLSQVKKLVRLSIQGTLLTNGAVESFNPPVTLEVLDLRGCWLLTIDSLRSFCKKYPGIRVRHDHLSLASADLNCSVPNAALSQKSLKASKLKQREGKSSVSPTLFNKEALDQRIKYSREELITMQHLSPPLAPPLDVDIAAPNMD